MTDNFTHPDPADAPTPDDGDPGDIPRMVEMGDEEIELVDASADCRDCSHYATCAILATFRRGMGVQTDESVLADPAEAAQGGVYEPGDEEQETPVDPYDLAVICGEYSVAEDER